METQADTLDSRLTQEREELGKNVSELETRAKAAVNWREHFDKSPGLMLGLAFGGGLLLSGFPAARSRLAPRESLHAARGNGREQARMPGLDAIVSALFAAGAGRVVKFLGDRVPDFRDELDSHRT